MLSTPQADLERFLADSYNLHSCLEIRHSNVRTETPRDSFEVRSPI